ncbi:hypothetical protein [Deinococcus altitudinis]|uniref:hypothetical protein n=1 Tax=Deinococcus altitudinis TaxID=468914 RepID=UPI00389139E5
MKRIVLALLLLSSAAACPVKPGFFANGQYRDTTGLTPQCTPAFRKLAAQVKPTEYSEIYRIDTDMEGGLKVLAAAQLLVSNGWRKVDMPGGGKSRAFGFEKGGKRIVITVRNETDYALVVVVADR